MNKDVNVTVIRKGSDVYVLAYRDDQRHEASRVMQRWCEDSRLNFTWREWEQAYAQMIRVAIVGPEL